jgi:methyl-accepting chemotaxis protein-1 (serine sensor receptor)
VAAEVRSLAQRCSQAARDIKRLIDESGQRVEQGTALVSQAGEAMGELVAQVRQVTDLLGAISVASAEQARGIEQVGRAVSDLDHSTQRNADMAEEAAAAAGSLRQQAASLTQTVAVFRVGLLEAR